MPPAAKPGGGGSPRLARGSLSEEEVIAGAMAIVERDGLEGLSMPKLAKKLGAGVMSIYWYFRSKDELIAAMADRAADEVFSRLPAPGEGPADEEVLRTYRSLYKELQRAPLYLRLCRADPRLLQPRAAVAPLLARWLAGELEVLRRLGVNPPEAMRLHGVLTPYTVGFVLMQDDDGPGSEGPTAEEIFAQSVDEMDPSELPTLRAAGNMGTVVDLGDDAFQEGMQLFVAGIKARFS